MHHNQARIAISATALVNMTSKVMPAFAIIEAAATCFAATGRQIEEPTLLDQAKQLIADARRDVRQVRDELVATDGATSTVNFNRLYDELVEADMVPAEPGELVSTYGEQGADAMFEKIDTFLTEGLDDSKIIAGLQSEQPADIMAAFEVSQKYQDRPQAIRNVSLLVAEARRESVGDDTLVSRRSQMNDVAKRA